MTAMRLPESVGPTLQRTRPLMTLGAIGPRWTQRSGHLVTCRSDGMPHDRQRRDERGSTILEPFESWYAREHPRMVATLLLATGDLDLATEGVDEACTRALARWERVSAMGAPTGWAYSVALNHAAKGGSVSQLGAHAASALGAANECAGPSWRGVGPGRSSTRAPASDRRAPSRGRPQRNRDRKCARHLAFDRLNHAP